MWGFYTPGLNPSPTHGESANKRHQLLSAAAAATLGLAGLIGAAAPAANAANTSPAKLYFPNVANCSTAANTPLYSGPGESGTAYTVSPPTNRVTGTVGDTITIENECAQDIWVNSGGLSAGSYISVPSTQSALITLSGNAGSNITILAGNTGLSSQLGGAPTTGTGPTPGPTPPNPSISQSAGAPAPVIQQFGMPATGTCDEAQPEGLNWSGVANGGWGISWAQWVNGGTGGAVCTRTLVYSTVQSKWVVT